MGKIDDGGPAFPQNLPDDFIWRLPGNPGGMTLRDWFAGQTLTRLIQLVEDGRLEDPRLPETASAAAVVASNAYAMADAMLKARNATNDT